ncbi:MAG: serine hydrolase domain-containing protein [Parasphingorhabdus sp.]|uniref:serine hydrolase domain-containing protein n=1 Tax=Parasphingorhabdus sp. TaxID=2709688 RepID=UPI0032991254
MKQYFLIALGTILAIVGWTILVFLNSSEGWLQEPLTTSRSSDAFMTAAEKIIDEQARGNIAMIMVEKGKVVESHYRSSGAPVDQDSVFQVASLSKWLTAWGVMVLVDDGLIDIDAPVEQYLTRWQLPNSEFDHSGVTIGRLLSHTGGLDDGLGYNGFDTASAVQTLEASLTRAKDASPGKNGIVKVGQEPGEEWNYSGGGYTLLQLVIEEVSGLAFADHMKKRVFEPLGMTRTTFDHGEAMAMGLAENFTPDGHTEPFRWYSALGATSLFTSAADMARFVESQGPSAVQSLLSDETRHKMATAHASSLGADVWGLGVMLYAPNNQGGFIIGHDGNNEPAINSAVRLDPATGNGIIILETGNALLATEIAGHWIFWKTGNIDNLAFAMKVDNMVQWILIGSILILIFGIGAGWRTRRSRQARAD